MATLKRYQYFSRDGIKWTKWFKLIFDKDRPKYQFGKKLLNEYKDDRES